MSANMRKARNKLIVPLRFYAALALPPLFLLTIMYMYGVGWRKKRDSEQQ